MDTTLQCHFVKKFYAVHRTQEPGMDRKFPGPVFYELKN